MTLVGYARLNRGQLQIPLLAEEMPMEDTTETKIRENKKTSSSPARLRDRQGDFISDQIDNPYYLPDPSNLVKKIEYDPKTNKYLLTEKIGGVYYRPPTYMTYEEYMEYTLKQSNQYYWKERSNAINLIEPKVSNNFKMKEDKSSRITGIPGQDLLRSAEGIGNPLKWQKPSAENFFGPGGVEIRPQGNVEVLLGGNHSYIDNPILTELQKRQGALDFDMQINLSVTAKIGDKIATTLKYNNGINFGTDAQRIKLGYTGKEDEWLRNIEAGDVNFTLPTQLITGAQSLFGIKTEFQFGRMNIMSVLSQQRSEKKSIVVENGAQRQNFEVNSDQYDANRHFFLGHFFRDNYERALSELPIINSQSTITNIEVWVTNRNNSTQNVRDIVVFADLGENTPYSDKIHPVGNKKPTSNDANDLYGKIKNEEKYRSISTSISELRNDLGIIPLQDFEKTFARKLAPSEYTLNPQLGFISLNSVLAPNEVLAVAYQYTLNGEIFQVGDLSKDIPTPDSSSTAPSRLLFLKMLKGSSVRPNLPIWDLMMKNVYSLGAYQIQNQNFRFNIFYNDPGGGQKRYMPKGNLQTKQLITVMGLDNLNNQNDPQPDGLFDFIPGTTINISNGRVYFPVLEPFGSHLEKEMIKAEDGNLVPIYVYNQLYDSTQIVASQFPEFNRFVIKGSYQSSSSSRINLGAFGLPQGSVIVSLNGQPLVEGLDYTVEYGIGQVNISDRVLSAGGQVKVDFENNSLFGFQTKNFMGSRWEYRFRDNLKIGGTVMNLSERPFTNKVNFGEDPIDNMMLGGDIKYNTNLPFLTKLLDKLPFYSTKEMSNISLYAEVAHLKPSHYRTIGNEGTVYLDDFEGAATGYPIGFPFNSWKLASTPRGAINGQNKTLFPEGDIINKFEYGYNRAKLGWYTIANFLVNGSSAAPEHLRFEDKSFYHRNYQITDIYPYKQNANILSYIPTLDLAFFPKERGPYNYEYSQSPTPGVSKGINSDGTLKEPKTRWAGIQRSIDNTNFEQTNFEYIQFWLLDPFIYNTNNSGDLYIDLGTISEDVLRDSRLSYENGQQDNQGAQKNLVDFTSWGQVPRTQPIVNSFDNNPNLRKYQDVGYDGLNNEYEKIFYKKFLDNVRGNVSTNVYNQIEKDPSNDDFTFYLDSSLIANKADVITLYKNFNGLENNSPVSSQSNGNLSNYSNPDNEDLNRDNTLNENEEYFQYRVPLFPGMDTKNNKYIASTLESKLSDGKGKTARWIQFKIPIKKFDNKYGGIQDFRNIQFMRIFLTDFQDSVILRFVDMQFLRNQWRTYEKSLEEGRDAFPIDNGDVTTFSINGVNLEENASKSPVNYVVPPDIPREIGVGVGRNIIQLNEQAMNLTFCNLKDGDARACFKNIEFDFRKYKTLRMFLHAESKNINELKDKDVSSFLRVGSDFIENYYEYEVPLLVSEPFVNPDAATRKDPEDTLKRKVWPTDNEIHLTIAQLAELKRERNRKGIPLNVPYTIKVGNRNLTILGNPDIGLVKTMMVGVRNRKVGDPFNFKADDDGLSKCGEVWVNEMRLVGLEEIGGTAALANVNVKLADLGTVALAGNMHTIGFGQIEHRVDQRYRDDFYQFSVNSNLNLGKLFPKVLGIQLPFFGQYGQSISTPEYDPYTYDIRYDNASDDIAIRFGADSASKYRTAGQTIDTRRGFSFNGVRIAPEFKQKRPHFWDIQNFTFNYSFNSEEKSNPFIETDWVRNYSGELIYAFSGGPKYIEPFKKIMKKDIAMLRLVKDLNINFFPSSVNFNSKMDRRFGILQQRALPGELPFNPLYDKFFTWDRVYGFAYNPFKSISITFNATNRARIDEPAGGLNSQKDVDSIWSRIKNFGRNISYNHALNATYNVPINKIPLLDFVNMNIGYGSTFNWIAGPLRLDKEQNRIVSNPQGNTLNTTQTEKATINLNMDQLYNKSIVLKKFNQPPSVSGKKDRLEKNKNIKIAKDKLREDVDREKKNLKKIKDEIQKIKGDEKLPDTLKKQQVKDLKKQVKSKRKQIAELRKNFRAKQLINPPILNTLVQPILSIKRVGFNYDINKSTILPGYMPGTRFFGIENRMEEPLHWQIAAGKQPGLPVLAPPDKNARTAWLDAAAGNGWITSDTNFNQQFQQQYSKTITGTATVEPLKDLKIDLTFKSSYTYRYSEIFKKLDVNGPYQHLTPLESGSYTYSDINLLTAFDKLDTFGLNRVYEVFEENRKVINQRLRLQNPNSSNDKFYDPIDSSYKDGYTLGYGPAQQDVVIPAFLAAYRKQDVNKTALNPFANIPLPNWNIVYNGLSKMKFAKKMFRSFTVRHGYNSETSITNFSTELRYRGDGQGTSPSAIDSITNNYYPYYFIPSVIINEAFNPLIGVDFTTVGAISGRFEVKSSRNLSLSFTDYTLTENANTTLTFGGGYKIKGFKKPIKLGKTKIDLKNDINLTLDISWSDNSVVIHRIGQGLHNFSQGSIRWNVSPKIDYMVNDKFNISIFFNHNRTYPKISTSFPTILTNYGIRLRFTLAQ
jgi:cell surface protein SprA